MSSLPSTLYTLQKFELAVDKARGRIEEIDRALENDEVVAARKSELEALQNELNQAKATVKDLELEIQSLNNKIEETNELLYSGKIKNSRELTDRQNELESLKRRHKKLESNMLEAMTTAEQLKKDVAEAEKALETAREAQRQKNADLIEEREKLGTQIKQNLRRRKDTLKDIPKDDYKHYRLLRKKKRGVAVARLRGTTCGLCGVGQTTTAVQDIKRNDEIVYCSNCGRILVSAQ